MTALSLAHLSMLDATPIELIGAAASAKFDGVGLRITSIRQLPAGVDLVSDISARREVLYRLDALGLKVFDVEAFTLTAVTDVRSFGYALDAAAELGAGNLLCAGNDDDPVRLRDNFAALCELADLRNIRVGIEFMPFNPVRTLASAMELLHRVRKSNAGLLLDILHFARSGGVPTDLAGLTESDFAFVQLCDAYSKRPAFEDLPQEARSGRLYPGEGELPLVEIMTYLPRNRHLSVEAPCAADAHLPFNVRAARTAHATKVFLAHIGWN